MKILVAPNSMKGSLNAFDFADTVEQAFKDYSNNFELRKIPVADGGDYTGEVLARHFNAQIKNLSVTEPLGKKVQSKYALTENTAIIEMADASGMKLVETEKLNPMQAGAQGTGELLFDAINENCKEIFVAIGGSATVDGGMGMMEAFGYHFYDENENQLKGNGQNLAKIKSFERVEAPNDIQIKIICDVDNPLLGSNGAASVFGPQKGASPEMVEHLETGLLNWVEILENHSKKELRNLQGAGAAGGIALPLVAFFNAEIVSGADFILQQLNLEEHIKWADLVITGEGKIDSQTLNNKAPFAVARMARNFDKPVIALAGKVEQDASDAFDGIYSIANGPISLEEAMTNSKQLLYILSSQLARSISKLNKVQE